MHCRSRRVKKIALFTNVEKNAVIPVRDADTIYQIPRSLHEQGLDNIVVRLLHLQNAKAVDLSEWDAVLDAHYHPTSEVTIGMVGKYMDLTESYKSLSEALNHAGIQTRTRVNVRYIDSETLEQEGVSLLANLDAIFSPRVVLALVVWKEKYWRHSMLVKMISPYLGICLGMQIALVEFARHQANMPKANSTEFDSGTAYPVVALVSEWQDETGETHQRDERSDLGGTMRLGGYVCQLKEGSLSQKIYQAREVSERHRHRYEVNNNLLPQLEAAGLIVSGRSQDGALVEMIEMPSHSWFVACQFHPEFKSTLRDGPPVVFFLY